MQPRVQFSRECLHSLISTLLLRLVAVFHAEFPSLPSFSFPSFRFTFLEFSSVMHRVAILLRRIVNRQTFRISRGSRGASGLSGAPRYRQGANDRSIYFGISSWSDVLVYLTERYRCNEDYSRSDVVTANRRIEGCLATIAYHDVR